MAGRLQNEDHKTEAELVTAGGTKAQLLNDTKIYVTAINKTLDDAIIDGDIGGGGGGESELVNYLTGDDFNFETTDVGNWVTYSDGGASPTNGIGGSPNITFARTVGTDLRGAAFGTITKDAANRQGEGISVDFSIDSADNQTQHMRVSFDHNGGGSFAEGDVTVHIYDVTNASLITVTPNEIDGTDGRFNGYWESDNSSTSYRLILHIASTNAGAWIQQIDNVIVGPQNYAPVFNERIELTIGNGHGSTANKIRRWTTITTNVGKDISLNQSATNGDNFTINTAGVYTVSYADRRGSGGEHMGISRNAPSLTSGISGTSNTYKIAIVQQGSSGNFLFCSRTLRLESGDIIRAHTDGLADGNDARCQFTIERIV